MPGKISAHVQYTETQILPGASKRQRMLKIPFTDSKDDFSGEIGELKGIKRGCFGVSKQNTEGENRIKISTRTVTVNGITRVHNGNFQGDVTFALSVTVAL